MNLKTFLMAAGLVMIISQSAFSSGPKNLNTKPSLKASGISVRIPECSSRPEFMYQNKTELDLAQMPKVILVGKNAEHYVESKTTKLKLHGVQSFTKAQSKIVCGTARQRENQSFSLYAPTVIDFTDGKGLVNSVWQFQLMASPKEFGVWNQQSRILSKPLSLEKRLQDIDGKVQFFQLSQNEYEMVISKETASTVEYLSVRFDAVTYLTL